MLAVTLGTTLQGRGLVLVLAGICLVAWAPATEPVSNPAVALGTWRECPLRRSRDVTSVCVRCTAANSTHAPQEARAPSSGTDAPGTGDVVRSGCMRVLHALWVGARLTKRVRFVTPSCGQRPCWVSQLSLLPAAAPPQGGLPWI